MQVICLKEINRLLQRKLLCHLQMPIDIFTLKQMSLYFIKLMILKIVQSQIALSDNLIVNQITNLEYQLIIKVESFLLITTLMDG